MIVVTPSWFLRITVMKSFNCIDCIFEVTSRVPNFVVLRRVAGPLGSVLELVVVEWGVDDFVEFVFVFSFYLDRRG